MKNLKGLWSKSPERVDDIGGEPLVGSGFEHEEPDTEFADQESGAEREE